MILGMPLFTLVHVAISLVGIASGFIVVAGFLSAKRFDAVAALFLATTALTSVTGFGFPFDHFLPSHFVGIISLVVLAIAVYARYVRHLVGVWRSTYVVGAVTALYLNVFVLIVQSFRRVPVLKAAAPTQSEPAFVIAQLIALVVFVAIGIVATINFRKVPSLRPDRAMA
jgi:hypothetical protein